MAKDFEIYHITYKKAKSLKRNRIINYWTYHKSSTIRRKRAKAYRSAYQKRYQLAGNLWGLEVKEGRSDYRPSIFSIV